MYNILRFADLSGPPIPAQVHFRRIERGLRLPNGQFVVAKLVKFMIQEA